MATFRTKHNKENRFAQINKGTIWDPNLSLEAIGLLTRFISRPDDWEINIKELQKSCHCGKNKIYKIINELIENGYVERSQTREVSNKKNQYGKYEYLIFETKEEREEFKKIMQRPQKQEAEKQEAENRDVYKEYISTNTDITKKENIKRKPLAPKGESESSTFSSSQRKETTQEAKELVDFVCQKVKQNNANAIVPETPQQLTRERKAADALLLQISPKNSETPPLAEALKIAKQVVTASFEDNFWKGKVHSVSYLKLKWNSLLTIFNKSINTTKKSFGHFQRDEHGVVVRHPWQDIDLTGEQCIF